MLVTHEKIEECLRKVVEVREYIKMYSPEPLGLVLNLADFHYAVQDICDLKIEVLEVTFEGQHLRGTTELYNDKTARVLIRSGQTEYEKRLAVAKELSHLLIDGEQDCSTDGAETIKELLQEWHVAKQNGVGHMDPPEPLVSEIMAFVVALQLLYSDEFQAADIEKLDQGVKTLQQISLEHEVPAHAIEQALDRHDDLKEFWEKIRNQE
jgi:hypothetical protein